MQGINLFQPQSLFDQLLRSFQLVWTINFRLVRCPCSVVFTILFWWPCTSQRLTVLSEILPFGNKFLDVMYGTEATVKFPVLLNGTRHSLHINVQYMGCVSYVWWRHQRGNLHQSAMLSVSSEWRHSYCLQNNRPGPLKRVLPKISHNQWQYYMSDMSFNIWSV
jgi:hypothetical protein